ncbi:MAG: amidohydrolase [Chlorobi bacterium]|nr:amidohydrolase [Chlorobiota bacterium]
MIESEWDMDPAILKEAINWRHWIHQHPELSMQEYETSAFIRQILDKYGIPYVFPAPGTETGIIAMLGNGAKAIGIRAELDALPISESTGLPFASVHDGVMHACGHDIHMTALLGLLVHLKTSDSLPTGVKILGIFQPSEEKIPGGAKLMIDAGIIEDFGIMIMLAQHVEPALPLGTIGVHSGPFMASSDELYITVEGHSGHAAQPHKNPNPIIATSSIIDYIYKFQIQMHSPIEPFLINIGKVCGGTTTNVVPDRVEVAGTIRTFNETTRKKTHELLNENLPEIARTYNCKALVNIKKGYPVLVNNEWLYETLKPAFEKAKFQVVEVPQRMGSDDFAYFSQKIPSFYWRLGTGAGNNPSNAYLHSSNLIITDEIIPFAIKALISAVETSGISLS